MDHFSCLSKPTTKDAYRLTTASLIFTFFGAYLGLVLYLATGSSLCLVFGMENVVDFISSLVVLWRFFAPDDLTESLETELQGREERASMAITFVMLLLGIVVCSTAIHDAARGPEEAIEYELLWYLSFLSILVFSVLTVLKMKYSELLNCQSLYKDGICSLIGTSLALVIMVNTWIVGRFRILWWIDPLAAFCAGMVALGLGLQSISEATQQGIPIFERSWWFQDTGGCKDSDGQCVSTSKGTSKDLNIEVVELPGDGSANGLPQGDKEIV